jgi:hypothetical protein
MGKNLGSSASSIYGFDFKFQPVTPGAAATLVKSSDLGLTKKILSRISVLILNHSE